MGFGLPYPLGGSPSEAFERSEQTAIEIAPPWLRGTIGGAILRTMGEIVDEVGIRAGLAVRARFPGTYEEALGRLGRDRLLPRGAGESVTSYVGRLERWLDDQPGRGSTRAMLEQWYAYMVGAEVQIDVVYYSGTRFVLGTDGTITQDSITWDADGSGDWAQAWCFLHYAADPGALTDAQTAAITLIPRQWIAAHMMPLHVVIIWPGARLWGYPTPLPTWDEQDDIYTWGDLPATYVTEAP